MNLSSFMTVRLEVESVGAPRPDMQRNRLGRPEPETPRKHREEQQT